MTARAGSSSSCTGRRLYDPSALRQTRLAHGLQCAEGSAAISPYFFRPEPRCFFLLHPHMGSIVAAYSDDSNLSAPMTPAESAQGTATKTVSVGKKYQATHHATAIQKPAQ